MILKFYLQASIYIIEKTNFYFQTLYKSCFFVSALNLDITLL